MHKVLVALAFSLTAGACATPQSKQAMAEECHLVDQDATGTHISVRQECKSVPQEQGAGAPQR